MKYDLIVIGSGPAGQKGAIAAAKLDKKVAIIERSPGCVGGVCLHTGTVPSKTMREAILFLTGFRQRDVYSQQYMQKRRITMDDLRLKLFEVIERERFVIVDQLERNFIDVFHGDAEFVNANSIKVDGQVLQAEDFLVATGTKPSRPDHIPFDGRRVFDSDEILAIESIPRSMIVIGGGVIGLEYGIMFATLGVRVTIVDGRERLLDFCDAEIVDHLMFSARALGIVFRLGENVVSVKTLNEQNVMIELESQKRILAEAAFFSVGRVGDTDYLNPQAAGLEIDHRGRLKCNEFFQTSVPHIYAVGDVIGFPSLASTSMEQGRQAINHIYGTTYHRPDHIPYGLFTIPEIAMIGKTEKELTAERIPYEVGVAKFEELAKSQISGGNEGILKLLFHQETRQLLGVHIIGDTATEIVHIGQMLISFGGKIDHLCDTVFNHPTIAESYKIAAFDGINRLCLEDGESEAEYTSTPMPLDLVAQLGTSSSVQIPTV
ncbi:MAG: Si-specific NAD(P)(+) transhydrogenase [Planctomycetota bacterium]